MEEKKTVAEKVAEIFEDDGMVFDSKEGDFDHICEMHGGFKEWKDGYRNGDTYKYVFDDNSVLTVDGCCWDFGYDDCFCMKGLKEHGKDCVNNIEPVDFI